MRTGAVLFVTRMDQVATFYSKVLDLDETGRGDDHIRLESAGFELLVHRIPGRSSAATEVAAPPVRRAQAAFKPVFVVASLASVRNLTDSHGGVMEPLEQEWAFDGVAVCDAMDPEGNVIQFRENRSPLHRNAT